MGCDIHTYVEQRDDGSWTRVGWAGGTRHGWEITEPFDWRHYGLYGWLADVRNSSEVPPVSQPRGLPEDVSPDVLREFEEWGCDAHTPSWISVDDLIAFDYDQTFEDRRVTRQIAPNAWHGACTADPGEGEIKTYREFFGPEFFADLAALNTLNKVRPTRVVFWFDN